MRKNMEKERIGTFQEKLDGIADNLSSVVRSADFKYGLPKVLSQNVFPFIAK